MKSLISSIKQRFKHQFRELTGSFSQRVSAFLHLKKIPRVLKEDADCHESSKIEELKAEVEEPKDRDNQAKSAVFDGHFEALLPNSGEDIYSVPYDDLGETIIALKQTLKRLNSEQERLILLLEEAKERQVIVNAGKQLIGKIITGEEFNSDLDKFETKIATVGQIQLLKDWLLEAQKQLETVPSATRGTVVVEFAQNDRLLRYIKALYGFRCQLCGFTFEQGDGEFYAETHYLNALSGDGRDNLDNIIVVCPNHHKMLEYAKVSIVDAKGEAVSLEINGKHHIITRIPLR